MRWEHVQRGEVVNAVGKFNNHDAHIFGHGNKHFTEIFDVALHATVLEFAEFGNAADQASHFAPKVFFDLFECDSCILGYVVEEGGDNNDGINFDVGQIISGREWVDDVWLA